MFGFRSCVDVFSLDQMFTAWQFFYTDTNEALPLREPIQNWPPNKALDLVWYNTNSNHTPWIFSTNVLKMINIFHWRQNVFSHSTLKKTLYKSSGTDIICLYVWREIDLLELKVDIKFKLSLSYSKLKEAQICWVWFRVSFDFWFRFMFHWSACF